MITMKMLRDRIHTANARECIADTLDLGASPEELAQSASDDIIYRAFVEGSIKSKVPEINCTDIHFPTSSL